MASSLKEPQQVGATDRGGPAVDQRVTVDDVVSHQGGMEHDADAPVAVIHRRKRGNRAGLDAERCAQELGRCERKPAGGTESSMQRSELDHRILERRDQKKRTLLVLEKQVFGMPARNRSAQLA